MAKKTEGLDFSEAQRHHNAINNGKDFASIYDAHLRPKPKLDCSGDVPLTQQHFEAECNINNIMKKYLNTGVVPQTLAVGRYGDFSQAGEYLDALMTIEKSNQQFAAMPSKVRNRFNNNPAEFLEFITNPANLDEAHELGLLSAEASAQVEARKTKQKAQSEKVTIQTLDTSGAKPKETT
ncbi:MAG: internal scaffolding protein [Microvirus sp.]|nr:MAG: internal scaffolding protein [Microvirus sp.]